MAAETVSFGGLSLVKKDGTHSQRFPLVERRYLFGRYIRRDEGGGGVRRRAVLATVPSRRHNAGFWGHGRYLTIGVWCVCVCARARLYPWRLSLRAEYCDIRINLLSVSREHAELVVDDKDQVHTPNRDNLQSCSRGAANGETGGASRLTRGQLGCECMCRRGTLCVSLAPPPL